MKLYQQLIIITPVLLSCSLVQANGVRYPIRAFQIAPQQDLKAFNEHLKAVVSQYPSAKLPLDLLKRLPVEPAGHTKAYHWCGKVKAGQQICTFREENIPDTSVVGVLQKITFKSTSAGWYAANIERAWRCQPGKGESKSYQIQLCD
ncbi:MAG: hypothetical protein WBP46_02925 [Thiolinea sp.]